MSELTALSDEQLELMAADLAKQRSAIREQQNAVQAELELRRALASMSAPAREAAILRLEGGITPKGETK